MTGIEKIARIGAIGVIWVLMALGALVAYAVPFLAASLASNYSGYWYDQALITAMLMTPTVLAETLLVIILVLLRQIRVDQMFSVAAHRWVRALAYNAAALSASVGAILTYLIIKNTLPPALGALLLIGIFLPLAVALVTRTLLAPLKQATFANQELEAVI